MLGRCRLSVASVLFLSAEDLPIEPSLHPSETVSVVSVPRALALRSLIGFAALLVFVPALLFLSAGTVSWPMGWAYVALSTVGSVVPRLLIARRNPDTLYERARGFEAEGVQPWDRWLLPVLIWTSVLTLLAAGLDHRFRWSGSESTPVQLVALAIAAMGYLFAGWAMVENRFFSSTVRIQSDRGHVVVSSGPYRVVRHPGYAGALLATVCVPIALGTWWAFVPAGIAAAALITRTALEDRVLRHDLEGYEAFASHTRRRLVPGVW
jgi:protein-S-isoprenylcysteine O-methyltransferase Ste14